MDDSHINYQTVDSSNVDAVGYDYEVGRLWVRFKDGSVYAYDRVEKSVYDGLLSSKSKGNYLFRVVRANGTDSVYAYRKVR